MVSLPSASNAREGMFGLAGPSMSWVTLAHSDHSVFCKLISRRTVLKAIDELDTEQYSDIYCIILAFWLLYFDVFTV